LCAVADVKTTTHAPPPQKQIDVGAEQAPLSDQQRLDLDSAVKKHDYAAERAVIDKAMAEHADSFELLTMAGRLAYLEKHPKDAVDALERAGKIKDLPEQDRMTLALSYEFSRQPNEARAEFVKLTKMAPQNAEYMYLLARVDRQNQQTEAAAEEFAAAIKLNPGLLRAYEELGQIQERVGRLEEAHKTYAAGADENRKRNARWEWSPLDLGVAELKANQDASAEKLFREALQYNPRFGWAHYYMGQVMQKRALDNDAVAEYKEAVVDDPRLRQAWLALGRELARKGDKVEADRCIAIFKKLEEQQNAIKGRKN
jgi:tetratricopeptide (TPR) repeat protein